MIFSLAAQGGSLAFCQSSRLDPAPDNLGSESQQSKDRPSAKAKAQYIPGDPLDGTQKNKMSCHKGLSARGDLLSQEEA